MKIVFKGKNYHVAKSNKYGIEVGKAYKGKYLVLGVKEIDNNTYVTYVNTSNEYRDIVTIDQFAKHIATVVV